ncbi:late histone H1-like isoform X2 [Ruditapes philippinarum]|uniref:late histone H1-like isoform X2 n=1 Tax=Ruditapes philippinarum TaxID=129788 RepID=UPI00295B0C2F|nr:late histone H1-like isoform X2 [Ruditapes philippinarum]
MAANEGTAVAKKPSTKTHPTYLEMAKEAITSLSDKKGSTVPSIQSYIAGKYAIDGDTVRIHLKPALAKGLENGTLARPKNSDAKGYTGRFKVDKAKATNEEKEKEKKKKLKEKEAKEKKTAAKKTATKTGEKKTVAKKPGVKKSPTKAKAGDKAKKVVKKTAGKKTPTKPKKTLVEKKPKAAKATLKTPKKTTKSLKAAKTKTPGSASASKSKK